MNSVAKYERNLTGSYMVLAVEEENQLDERILQKNCPTGILPMEKLYMDGQGEYWYQISGKQSLDLYCGMKVVGIEIVEKLILGVCSQIKILEQNLLRPEGLLLEPEYIYMEHLTQEMHFIYYPGASQPLPIQLQRLMEYLLTKIDHKDTQAVEVAYALYEKTLEEGYRVWDIQDTIMKKRQKRYEREACSQEGNDTKEIVTSLEKIGETKWETSNLKKMWTAIAEKIKTKFNNITLFNKIGDLKKNTRRKEKLLEEIDPLYEGQEEEYFGAKHPTICLSDYREHPEGMLLYEGYESFTDIRLEKKNYIIGKGRTSDLIVNKDTISHVHAKLSYDNEDWYLEDLNSTNGTYVNGAMLMYHERRKIVSNDILCFADVKYRFV